MKQKWIVSATAIALTLTAATTQASLKITEAMSISAVPNGGGTDDWFELYNNGATAVDITGYTMDDSSAAFATSVALNGITSIAPGEAVVFIEDADTTGTAVTSFKTFWGSLGSVQVGTYSGSGVGLSQNGDGVTIFDGSAAHNTVDLVTFGAATIGSSFSYPITGTGGTAAVSASRLSNSAAPQNVGTPGSVPEPTTLALLSLASVALLKRRN